MFADFEKVGAKIFGVSMDNNESHVAFAKKHNLNFPLLPDTDGKIAAQFGVSTESGYAKRTTFVIGPNQKIANVYPEMDLRQHAAEVLAAVMALSK